MMISDWIKISKILGKLCTAGILTIRHNSGGKLRNMETHSNDLCLIF